MYPHRLYRWNISGGRGLTGISSLWEPFATQVHFVYVDEVQDLSPAQIALFRFVCGNPKGFVFGGDTAQTIMRGVGFRFQDLRALFYREFLQGGAGGADPNSKDLAHKDLTKDLGKEVPELQQLTQNFRTHAGVLGLANSVVTLLVRWFPETVDRMREETALVQGQRPVFLTATSSSDLIMHLFGSGVDGTPAAGEFGAEQAILVRNQAAKAQVEAVISSGLVLTVYEAKGLEFQDVLLYNFFTDSPAPASKWRAVYEALGDKDTPEPSDKTAEARSDRSGVQRSHGFSQQTHGLLDGELKNLYVGITRAKQHLWIFDEDVDRRKPMLDLWTRKGLVLPVGELGGAVDTGILELARKSTPEAWERQGRTLFNRGLYGEAQLCFKKSGNLGAERWAQASALQQQAKALEGGDVAKAQHIFCEAAAIFVGLEKPEKAAKCFKSAGEYQKAGDMLMQAQQPLEAAKCYALGGHTLAAARAFDAAGEKARRAALEMCLEGGHLKVGTEMLVRWEQGAARPGAAAELVKMKHQYHRQCALAGHKAKDEASMLGFVVLFPTVDERQVHPF
jgi:tetratricopeptide (TPR) repeat protein